MRTISWLVVLAACNPTPIVPEPGDPALPVDPEPSPPVEPEPEPDPPTVDPDAPVAVDDAVDVTEGGDVVIDVLDNDVDTEDDIDPDSVLFIDAPAVGTATVRPDGTIGYRHDRSETATDTLTYTVEDEDGRVSNVGTVTITITPVNDLPVAVPDNAAVDEGGSVVVDLAANDTDADDGLDLTSLTIVGPPLRGSVAVNADGTVDYTHDGGEGAIDEFSYTIADLSGARSLAAWVELAVVAVNDPPVANDDALLALVGGATDLFVLANDVDPEGGLASGSVTIVGDPANGTLTLPGDGTVTYTHDGGPSTVDQFSYTVADTAGLVSAVAVVDLEIVATLPVQVELTPSDGSLVDSTFDPFWANKGYEFTASQTFSITGGAWWIDVPAGGFVRLSVYDAAGQLLARGTQGVGDGSERWVQSDLAFTFDAGLVYTVSFYTDLAGSSIFDFKDNPTFGYAVGAEMSGLTGRSSSAAGDFAAEGYPDYFGNSWAPFQRLDIVQ